MGEEFKNSQVNLRLQNDFHESIRRGWVNKLELYLRVPRYQTETHKKIFLAETGLAQW